MGAFTALVRKATPPTLSPVHDGRGFYPYGTFTIQEPFSGAFQRDIAWTNETVLAHHAVYACVTLIAADIAKLRIKLVQQDDNGIWTERTKQSAFSPVLRKPNHFQTRIQFIEQWVTSKLLRGNAYILKEYDNRGGSEFEGVVRAMYVLDPQRVQPLVAPDGSVFYKLHSDNIAGIEDKTVPADAIIHDRMNCLFHPLVGTSPIFASGNAANMGMQMQQNATRFYANDRSPHGALTAPGVIDEPTAEKIKARWRNRQRGDVAVLGNGLTYVPLTMTAEDSQMIEHLRWSGEVVCSAFHVPSEKANITPTTNKSDAIDARYYSDCLQSHIEHIELCLDEGLGLTESKGGITYGVELDIRGLIRMDEQSQINTLKEAVAGSLMATNEARKVIDLPPKKGGDSIRSQQQYYDIAALAERDADKPFSKPEPGPEATPPNAPAPEPEEEPEEEVDEEEERALLDLFRKAIAA